MTLPKRIKRFLTNLVLLMLCSLLAEQMVYLVLVPGYGWNLLGSPVLWGLFSVVCFTLLWRFDHKYPDEYSGKDSVIHSVGYSLGETNPATGLPMAGALDVGGNPYGGDDSVRFNLI